MTIVNQVLDGGVASRIQERIQKGNTPAHITERYK